jgi:PAS domain S-box-containing protein
LADSAGCWESVNRRWLDYTGLDAAALLGLGWQTVLHPEDRSAWISRWEESARAGAAFEVECRLRRRDGLHRWFLVRAEPCPDQAPPTRWLGTATDIDDLRTHAREALEEADHHKDEFLAMLAHELRNPLGPIANAVRFLQLTGPAEPSLQEARSTIERQVAHMARLMGDLLDVSRVVRGRISLCKELCDLTRIVRQTVADYRSLFEVGKLQLDLQIPADSLWILGDPVRVAQAISNVLQNAARFTDPGGRVTVTLTAEPGEQAVLSIRDTGIGMEPEMLRRLFEPFRQADHSLERSRGGLGLGLTLVKELIDLHEGTITAASAGIGQGSELTIRLPLQPPPRDAPVGQGAEQSPPGEPSSISVQTYRILVIEDMPDAAESLRLLLTALGHRVGVATTGSAGLEAARDFQPEVVVCDIGLPGGMDGYAVARSLRADPSRSGALLIALTGYGQEEDRRQALAAGFDFHLVKPLDFECLQNILDTRPEQRC